MADARRLGMNSRYCSRSTDEHRHHRVSEKVGNPNSSGLMDLLSLRDICCTCTHKCTTQSLVKPLGMVIVVLTVCIVHPTKK